MVAPLALAHAPARGPFLQNAGQHHITICWETLDPLTATVVVRDQAGRQIASVQTHNSEHQEVRIGGLQPGTRYHYSVVSSSWKTDPAWQGTFQTAPRRGTPITFAIWGDSRNNPDACQHITKAILRSSAPMCIHSGDFLHSGVMMREWDEMFFRPARDMLRSVVLWPAVGNHELRRPREMQELSGRSVYTSTFALPGKEYYYSFDYGDAHFLVLDSNVDMYDNAEQYAFACRDLERTRARWKIVVSHHPAFLSGEHVDDVQIRSRYCPLLARCNVDLLVAGHTHGFQLSRPIVHLLEPRQQHPYWQVISGGGGAPLHDLSAPAWWAAKQTAVRHWILVRIDGDRLEADVIAEDGTRIADFAIDKREPVRGAVAYEALELQRVGRDLLKRLSARPARVSTQMAPYLEP